ncbi:MAG: glycerophosphodiester phosphodiesterase [Myxococcota bacterium]|nr:glycerophosphodiester phosphodiesterase [Myxococcota bacterium]
MKLWAHRGSHGRNGLLENTCPAFERAIQEGADGIELDVHLSANGTPMVFHDETLTRLAINGDRRALSQVCDDELLAVELVGGAFMPTLEAVLEQCGGRIAINIEIKDEKAVDATSGLLRRLGTPQVLLSSFSASALVHSATVAPVIPRAWISGDMPARDDTLAANHWPLFELHKTRATRWHTSEYFCHPLMIGHLAMRNISTHVWTVNSPDVARRLADMGVAGIFTDAPGGMRRALSGGSSTLVL